MRKKTFEPMTLTHEPLEMNQAVAGACALTPQYGVICDDCDNGRSTGTHTWTVYANGEFGIGVSDQDVVDGSERNPPSGAVLAFSDCANYGVKRGDTFAAYDPPRSGHWDPNGNDIHGGGGFVPAVLNDYATGTNGALVYNQNS